MKNDTLDFHVDRLEDRQMLAGNVTVEVTRAGDLKITGDAENNDILVERVGSLLEFSGGNSSTTMNGASSFRIRRTSFRNLRVDLKSGGGRLDFVADASFKNGRVKLGSGDTQINALGFARANFSGNLKVTLSAISNPISNVGGRFGDNQVFLSEVTVEGNLTIRGNSKTSDRVVFDDNRGGGDFQGKTTVRLSGGDDIVELNGGHFHQLLTDGGRGNDTLGGSGITWDEIPRHHNFELLE